MATVVLAVVAVRARAVRRTPLRGTGAATVVRWRGGAVARRIGSATRRIGGVVAAAVRRGGSARRLGTRHDGLSEVAMDWRWIPVVRESRPSQSMAPQTSDELPAGPSSTGEAGGAVAGACAGAAAADPPPSPPTLLLLARASFSCFHRAFGGIENR